MKIIIMHCSSSVTIHHVCVAPSTASSRFQRMWAWTTLTFLFQIVYFNCRFTNFATRNLRLLRKSYLGPVSCALLSQILMHYLCLSLDLFKKSCAYWTMQSFIYCVDHILCFGLVFLFKNTLYNYVFDVTLITI